MHSTWLCIFSLNTSLWSLDNVEPSLQWNTRDAVVQRQKSLALDHSLKAEKSTALVEQHRSPDLDLNCGRQSAEKKCGKTLGGWRKADLLLPWLAAQVQWAKTHIFYNGGRCCRVSWSVFFFSHSLFSSLQLAELSAQPSCWIFSPQHGTWRTSHFNM